MPQVSLQRTLEQPLCRRKSKTGSLISQEIQNHSLRPDRKWQGVSLESSAQIDTGSIKEVAFPAIVKQSSGNPARPASAAPETPTPTHITAGQKVKNRAQDSAYSFASPNAPAVTILPLRAMAIATPQFLGRLHHGTAFELRFWKSCVPPVLVTYLISRNSCDVSL